MLASGLADPVSASLRDRRDTRPVSRLAGLSRADCPPGSALPSGRWAAAHGVRNNARQGCGEFVHHPRAPRPEFEFSQATGDHLGRCRGDRTAAAGRPFA